MTYIPVLLHLHLLINQLRLDIKYVVASVFLCYFVIYNWGLALDASQDRTTLCAIQLLSLVACQKLLSGSISG
jgi:hypothetical protein